MIGEPTEEELTEVLVEFHQRGQATVRPVGPPTPIEINTTIQPYVPFADKKEPEKRLPLVEAPRALAFDDKFFDFVPSAFFGTPTGFYLFFQWYFRCHTPGGIGHESYIRLYPGGYWRVPGPPAYSGTLQYGFNGSTWTPPASTEQGVFVQLTIQLMGVPTGVYLYTGSCVFAMYIQQKASPYTISDGIYPVGQVPSWEWYNITDGIGVNATFTFINKP